jgi:hypothetical protein
MPRSRTLALAGAAALLLMSAAPVAAQEASPDSAMDMEGLTVEVGGVEYAYTGLPTSLPAGTELTFRNDGAELHELVVLRIADGVTESLEELLAMEAEGRDPMAEGLVEFIGGAPLIANPGEVAEGSLPLEREGSYVALCFIPQGFVPSELAALGVTLEMLGPDTDPADLPPEVQEVMANPPHLAAGMIQQFTVTAEGTEAGPLPEPASDEMPPEDEDAASDEESAPEDEEAASE